MKHLSTPLQFFIGLAKVQSVVSRRFDSGLQGLSFSDFQILVHLSQAREGKLRRVDLAEKVGLTASGITRLLAPMEKVGLIKREKHVNDARVSYVLLAPGGRRKLEEALENADLLSEELLRHVDGKFVKEASTMLGDLGGRSL